MAMGFFEEASEALRVCKDAPVTQLVLGWRASYVVASDGRWGVGFVPPELHTARPAHTDALVKASLVQLSELLVSPFSQEFAAATAACDALLPFPQGGFELDHVMPVARGDRVAVLGYDRDLLPFMRDWGWRVAVFDDQGKGPDCFPQEDFPRGVAKAEWAWLSPDALRDRWLLSTSELLTRKKGCFLQGPGLPYLKRPLADLGVTHIAAPRAVGDPDSVRAHIAAGGSPWLCRDLEWRVHSAP